MSTTIKTGPITPSEVQNAKEESLPGEVFMAFNDAIVRAWDGRRAVVRQDEVATVVAATLDISVAEVFNRRLMDVEGAFQKAGWAVSYDKPGYNESYPATFTFTRRR